GEVGLVEAVHLVGEKLQMLFVQGGVQLGGCALGDIDAVVVLLSQKIVRPDGFQRAEGIAEGELVEEVVLYIFGKLRREQRFAAHRRKLLELAPLGAGDCAVRQQKVQHHKAQ